ncbi:hypothetical protein BJ508DRAFT_111394 [Ascobolus immersus RN42]|uniref:Uncharacterized protein n=1 Tax=Ascobolus immersus RN42 TaxID=1160509 RepID=A0A3N4IIZ5_ASCIM|nr:hypothetical protein BJ508DRAFT_111394 [Ascobolus immersus RN42]
MSLWHSKCCKKGRILRWRILFAAPPTSSRILIVRLVQADCPMRYLQPRMDCLVCIMHVSMVCGYEKVFTFMGRCSPTFSYANIAYSNTAAGFIPYAGFR